MTDMVKIHAASPQDNPVALLDGQVEGERGTVNISATDGRPDVCFVGELIGRVSTWRPRATMWKELEVYRTRRGNFVLLDKGMSAIEGHKAFCQVEVLRSLEDLGEYLGYSRLATDLYRKLGLGCVRIA
jgi:hypothetical protein